MQSPPAFIQFLALFLCFLLLTFPTQLTEAGENIGRHANARDLRTQLWRPLQRIPRDVPTPASDHPGNVFLVGEEVTVKLPDDLPTEAVRWQMLNDRRVIVNGGSLGRRSQSDGQAIKMGKLGIGWYRIEFLDAAGKVLAWTTSAVLAQLVEPVPQDSPVCVDSATSWFARNDPVKQERFAQLAALAGVNWIRDRISWAGTQTAPDKFPANTTYDSAATLQARHGLKVLQVFHDIPRWARDKQLDGQRASRRFPRDLRALYDYCKAMGRRYESRVLAWEPWNEANITVFGGHTIDEMCTHQKAAYLGFKAGNSDLTVCWNVYAGAGTSLHAEGALANEVWPYFETYNIHSYRTPEEYLEQFAPAREAACGRPIWITECGIPLPSKTGGQWSELSQDDELKQAKFVARSYSSSLYAGVSRHFFFILGNFLERGIQFGLLRQDQTPRPGYVALAAVGRFLAGATPLGRWLPEGNPSIRTYAFRSSPDGKQRDVLVIWAEKPTSWSLPEGLPIETIYDYLGRPFGKSLPVKMDSAAVFVALPKGAIQKLPLEPPLSSSAFRSGRPSPVVLQFQSPHTASDLSRQAHVVALEEDRNLEVFAYNFSEKTVSGIVTVECIPRGWELAPGRGEITLDPMERKRLPMQLSTHPAGGSPTDDGWIKLRGDFADAGRPVLAFRLVPGPAEP